MIMAAVRMNIPAVVCSGGPMMSGLVKGEETSLSKMFEAVGARKADIIDEMCIRDRSAASTCEGSSIVAVRKAHRIFAVFFI